MTAQPMSRLDRQPGWLGHFDGLTWQAMLIAHLVVSLVLLIGVLWVHPSLRLALRRAYVE